MKKMTFKTSSEFNEAFAAFQNTTLSKNLNEKFRVKPFFEQYQSLRKVVNVLSYTINFFAVVTSFVGVFAFLVSVTHSTILAALFAVAFLSLLELLKRYTIPKAVKEWLQFRRFSIALIFFSVVFTGLSIGLSYSGAHDAIKLMTPKAELIDTETPKNEYKERITALEKQKREIKRSMSWQGKLTPEGAKAYNQITNQIGRLENDKMQNLNRITATNDSTAKSHSEATTLRGEYFALFTLFFDLMLFVAFGFMEYYDYRSFTEFADNESDQTGGSSYEPQNVATNLSNGVATPATAQNTDFDTSAATSNNGFSLNANALQLAMKKAKANISAYTTKLNNKDGNPETNQAGINRWQNQLQELEQMQTSVTV